MPTYEYACTACGHHFEVSQSFTDAALEACPSCGGQLRKVFGSIGIVLKGSGFYKTDSRAAASKSSSQDGGKGAAEKTSTTSAGSSGESSSSSSAPPAPSAPSSGSSSDTKSKPPAKAATA